MDPRDRDLIARTIIGEAANQPFTGQQAVANVILNRLRSGRFGGSVADVVTAPYQFEPWQTRRGELEAIRPDSPAYARATQAIDAALSGDVTGGATHFLEPNIVRQRGTYKNPNGLPDWAQGPSVPIGNHLFFAPNGQLVAPAKPTEPPAAAPMAAPPAQPTYSPPAQPTPVVQDVASAFTAFSPPPLTFTSNAQQSAPQGNSNEDVIWTDPAFQPRTTMSSRRRSSSKVM